MIRALIIRFLQTHKCILVVIGYIYSIIHGTSPYYLFQKNISCRGAYLCHVKISITGKGSSLVIGPRSVLRNCNIVISGNNARIYIKGCGTLLKNVSIVVKDDDGSILIGSNFTMEGGMMEALEGMKISIGNDCMFSSDINIITGDYHVITKKGTEERVNVSRSITIGNHVWLARGVSVLKGSYIADNSVVGSGAIVSGDLSISNSIYAGIPAHKIKDDIDWRRDRK